MFRNLLVLPLLSCILLFTGCSWLSEFLVFNHTDGNIQVHVLPHDRDTTKSAFQPKAYKIERWKDGMPELSNEVPIALKRNADGTCDVDLPSNTALVIAQGLNIDLRTAEGRKQLLANVDSLTIVAANSRVVVCTHDLCEPGSIAIGMGRAGIVFSH